MMTRYLYPIEKSFIEKILKDKQDFSNTLSHLSEAVVEEMDDGGMGGLRFLSEKEGRRLGKSIAETTFTDEDGVVVSVVLNLDNYGQLYEMDVWKTDFSPLKRFPIN